MLKIKFGHFLRKVLVILTALFSCQVFAEEDPYILMQKASDKLFTDILKNQQKIKDNPEVLKFIVRENLMPYVHVNYAGSLFLGQYFRKTTSEQRVAFFSEFRGFIEKTYAQILTLYKDQKIEIEKPTKSLETQISIRVKVIQKTSIPAIHLDFFWRKNSKSGKWQVYDMAVEGISIIDTKRQEWLPILRQSGIEALTMKMKQATNEAIILEK